MMLSGLEKYMLVKLIRVFVGLCLMLPGLAMVSYAQEVVDLYKVSIVLPEQEVDDNTLFSQAFKVLWQRLHYDASKMPTLNISEYVQSFAPNPDTKTAVISFHESSLQTLFKARNIQVLGKNRPQILLWLTPNDERKLCKEEEFFNFDLMPAIDAFLQEKKSLVMLPNFDLQDLKITATNFKDNILRYHADLVLLGKLEGKQSSWSIISARNQVLLQWVERAPEVKIQVMTALHRTHTELVKGLMEQEAQVELLSVEMLIDNVVSISDYIEVLNYLRGISAIRDVLPLKVEHSQVHLRVLSVHDASVLRSMLVGQHLVAAAAAEPNTSAESDTTALLRYRWQASER
jgi:hypothetical protein